MNGNTCSTARNGFRKHSLALALVAGFTTTGVAQAATWEVTITNLTNGNYFAPLLVTAHPHDTHLFEVGMPASPPLEHMAECGHLMPLLLTPAVGSADADTKANPAGGPLAPGMSTTTTLDTTETHLSVVSMIMPANDAFLGLESQHIPDDATATYTYYVNAYDAGTEANDEVLRIGDGANCLPTDSGILSSTAGMGLGLNGTGVATADSNTNIHVHRGVLGDQDDTGGTSDLNSTIHRWQNPVARITVTVTP